MKFKKAMVALAVSARHQRLQQRPQRRQLASLIRLRMLLQSRCLLKLFLLVALLLPAQSTSSQSKICGRQRTVGRYSSGCFFKISAADKRFGPYE